MVCGWDCGPQCSHSWLCDGNLGRQSWWQSSEGMRGWIRPFCLSFSEPRSWAPIPKGNVWACVAFLNTPTPLLPSHAFPICGLSGMLSPPGPDPTLWLILGGKHLFFIQMMNIKLFFTCSWTVWWWDRWGFQSPSSDGVIATFLVQGVSATHARSGGNVGPWESWGSVIMSDFYGSHVEPWFSLNLSPPYSHPTNILYTPNFQAIPPS